MHKKGIRLPEYLLSKNQFDEEVEFS